jgi:hypothetical protein
MNWSVKDVMIQSWEEQGTANCDFGNYFARLLRPDFHFPRQILFSLLAQKLERALAEFRIVR